VSTERIASWSRRWARAARTALVLGSVACSRQPAEGVQDSWNPESIALAIDQCKAGAWAVPPEASTRGCECLVAEIRRRFPSPRRYDEDVETNLKMLVDAGVIARCREVAGWAPASPRPSSTP
jgi:hypothetical protein